MATHSKKVDPSLPLPYQAFTNDTGVTGAVTFADGDYIDFTACLGRPAKSVKFILHGTVDITIQFNTRLKIGKLQTEEPEETITMPEANTMVNPIRIFNTTGVREFELPEAFAIDIIKIVDYTGTASASNNLTVIGY